MDHDDLAARIAVVEDETETLAETIARSRRLVLLSRAAALAGAAWLVAALFGLASWTAGALVLAIAAMIGGTVLAGSSVGTIREAEARVDDLRTLRDRLIDAVSPHPVGAGLTEPHRMERQSD